MWSLPADYDSKVRRIVERRAAGEWKARGKVAGRRIGPMFVIAAFAVIERSHCLVLDDYAKLLFTPSCVFIRLPAAMRADSYKRYTCYNCPKEDWDTSIICMRALSLIGPP